MSDDSTAAPATPRDARPVGRVIGTDDATPLEYWVAIADDHFLQLDDIVALTDALDHEFAQAPTLVKRRLSQAATRRDVGVF